MDDKTEKKKICLEQGSIHHSLHSSHGAIHDNFYERVRLEKASRYLHRRWGQETLLRTDELKGFKHVRLNL